MPLRVGGANGSSSRTAVHSTVGHERPTGFFPSAHEADGVPAEHRGVALGKPHRGVDREPEPFKAGADRHRVSQHGTTTAQTIVGGVINTAMVSGNSRVGV
jgi:hypothetical protein